MSDLASAELDRLARRAARGDAEAFASLIGTLAPSWYRLALRLLGDSGLADETTQDVAIRVFYALPKWRGASSVRTWAYRITLNACRDAQRNMRRQERVVAIHDVPETSFPGHVPADAADPLLLDALAQAMVTLPDELAVIVTLRFDAGLRFAEIAQVLGIPQGTVSTRLRRALAQLAEALGPRLAKE